MPRFFVSDSAVAEGAGRVLDPIEGIRKAAVPDQRAR